MRCDEILKEVIEETKPKKTVMANAIGVKQNSLSSVLNRGNIHTNTLIDILEYMGYEVVIQKKTQGRRKDGQYVLTKEKTNKEE